MKIIKRLTRFDHTAYLVGGCVRDLLLDRHPKDFDIGTTATPRQVRRLFSNCRIIGRRFRLAHVYFQNGKIIEVATFRARDVDDAGDATDDDRGDLLIRDDNVFGTPEEDALRRDFTINALFYDVNDGNVLDHTDGLGDLRRRLVRTIGEPEIRFREDPIRILRAVKFAARLDFEIEERTLDALKVTRNLIPRAATSRTLEEINRFCRGGAARRSFELLRDTGVLEVILPDFAERFHDDRRAWELVLALLDEVDRRHADGIGISTGEILVVLLLPLLAPRLGWQQDGTARRSPGADVRQMVDEFMRPTALRLKVSRRDQEQCRQILATLHRLVPVGNLRRAARQAMLRRPSLPASLWILQVASARLGGDFTTAFDYWKGLALPRAGASPGAESRPTSESGAAPPAAARGHESERRRRSSRRRRSRRRPREAADEPARGGSSPETPDAPQAALPPPWDDRYFFAALPTVPAIPGENETAGTDAPHEGSQKSASGVQAGDAEGAPAKSKRRRRRRRRARSGGGGGVPDTGEPGA